jgi:FkbM family methyltransferase
VIKRALRALRAERNLRRDARALGASVADFRSASGSTAASVTLETKFGPLTWRPRQTDLRVIFDVLVRGDYDLSRTPQMNTIRARYETILSRGEAPVIIDAGANVGAASIWFSELFDKAQIAAVEPDAGNANLARANTSARPNIRVFEAAIGASSGSVVVQEFEGEAWGSRTIKSEVGVPMVTVSELLQAFPRGSLFIVKVDIEGFESDLFADNVEWIADAAAIIIEPHDWMLPGQGTTQPLQRAMLGAGREILIIGENLVFV